MLSICAYYAGIMLNAFATYYAHNYAGMHNRLKPTAHPLICAICDITVAMKKVAQNPAALAS